jgi:hypothetical protein
MARLGVTYQDIAHAANQLIGQGKQPTIEMIRHLLGTGSSTTIANHLRKWRAEQDGSTGMAMKENLPQEFVALMKGLWERLVHHANEKIAHAEEQAHLDISTAQNELLSVKQDYARAQQQGQQLQQENLSLKHDKQALEQAYLNEKMEHASLKSTYDGTLKQLEEKQDRITELSRLHAQAQANLEHYREATREQRLLDQQQYEQQKQEWLTEIKNLKEQMLIVHERATSLQQHFQSLKGSYDVLERDHAKSLSDLEKQCAERVEIEKERDEHVQASQHWHSQYKDIQHVLDSKTVQFIQIQTEANMALQQLAATKESLATALDQNKLLGHEKWELAQEKAQLQGQVKQLERIKMTELEV